MCYVMPCKCVLWVVAISNSCCLGSRGALVCSDCVCAVMFCVLRGSCFVVGVFVMLLFCYFVLFSCALFYYAFEVCSD